MVLRGANNGAVSLVNEGTGKRALVQVFGALGRAFVVEWLAFAPAWRAGGLGYECAAHAQGVKGIFDFCH